VRFGSSSPMNPSAALIRGSAQAASFAGGLALDPDRRIGFVP
jgi:hypothetical protein